MATKYFMDTEFLEGTQKTMFGNTKPTIDLISIGMIDENGREFYAISKDFNLKEVWNRWDKKECCKIPSMCGAKITGHCEGFKREYWIRDNILRPIYDELLKKERYARQHHEGLVEPFTYKTLKNLISWNGKHNYEIANDICAFIYGDDCGGSGMSAIEMATKYHVSDKSKEPEFYGYYSAYDHVVFCWLFGKMKDLPKGFPKYCRDLKQIFDEVQKHFIDNKIETVKMTEDISIIEGLLPKEKHYSLKNLSNYPKQINEHNALDDAKFNKELFLFLETLKK